MQPILLGANKMDNGCLIVPLAMGPVFQVCSTLTWTMINRLAPGKHQKRAMGLNAAGM